MHKLFNARRRGHLDELLAEVVAELVGHHIWQDVQHHVDEARSEEALA